MLVAVVALFSTAFASAQLTTAEPVASKIKGGNRAEAGDFGLYMGATSTMFKGWLDSSIKVEALPLINFKYMATDRFEARLGLEIYREKTKDSAVQDAGDRYSTISSNNKTVNSDVCLYPGIAYHFAPKNILDVYVGAELPIGWTRDVTIAEYGNVSSTIKGSSFNIGVGAFVGLQAYIADLPLALGVEYGISAVHEAALKYKNSIVDNDGKLSVFYTKPGSTVEYNDLKSKEGGIGSQIRLTFTYYFGK